MWPTNLAQLFRVHALFTGAEQTDATLGSCAGHCMYELFKEYQVPQKVEDQ